MREAFGTSHRDYKRQTKNDALSVYVDETLRILTTARVRELVQQWRHESGFHSPEDENRP